MIGNISKSKGFKGDTGAIGPQGPQGIQGVKGDTPAIVLRLDNAGNLYYNSDGILIDKEYVETQNYATKEYVDNAVANGCDTINNATDKKIQELKEMVDLLYAKSLTKTVFIDLLALNWVKNSDNKYSQVVSIDGITENSKIDLQPNTEQLVIFYEKDLTFVAENKDGVVSVYCVGRVPENDYTIQATVTEVA